METLENRFSIIERLLDEEHLFLNPNLSFAVLCRCVGVDEGAMERYLLSELGIGGEEMLSKLRGSMPERLERKYGIKLGMELFF